MIDETATEGAEVVDGELVGGAAAVHGEGAVAPPAGASRPDAAPAQRAGRHGASALALSGAALPAVQAAAVVAGGFAAGVATVTVARRARLRRAARRRSRSRSGGVLADVVASRSFLVDVHLIERR